MGKLKLMTIIGTRPEIIRLSATIKCCDRYFDQILVHTGQNYDYTLNQVFFDDLGLRAPDFYLNAVGDDLGATIGNIIERSYKLMVQEKPDAVLVLGDTNSCLSVIGAKRLHIPIFHMEAGNRCKDECLPEETNRRIVDIISDVNLCYSEHARRYLMECGLPKERTFVTGSPMAEVLHANLDKIEASNVHQRLGLTKGQYILPRSKPAMCWSGWALKKGAISCSRPIGRKISIQTAILPNCSQRSMPWQRSMICQSFTPATPEAESGWRRRDSSWTPV